MDRELPERKRIRDAELMRALAHPLRGAILNHLMARGPRTASECATAVSSSASNCSWHLRQLERYGLVERAVAEEADGRQRPWQATQVGLDFGGLDEDPELRSAQLALAGARLREEQELTQRFLDAAESMPTPWRDAAALNAYALLVTPDELTDLVAAMDRLLRPYVAPIRADPPDEALPVHVGLRAFPRVEAGGEA